MSELIAAEASMYGMIGRAEDKYNRFKSAREKYEEVLKKVLTQFWDIYNNLDPDVDGYDWEGQRIINIKELFENDVINYVNALSSQYYDIVSQLNEKISTLEESIQELRRNREYYLMCIEEEKKKGD